METNERSTSRAPLAKVPRFAEWNAGALVRSTQTASLAWKLRQLNFWMLGLFIALGVLVAKMPALAGAFASLYGLIFARLFYRSKPSAEVLDLKDPSSPIPAIPVDLVLKYSGYVYGEDHGIVSFVDGWMVYEGEDCSFSVKAQDVNKNITKRGQTDQIDFTYFEFGSWRKEYLMGLRPKGLNLNATTSSTDPLAVPLHDWLDVEAPVPGESVYPPAVPHPGTVAIAKLGRNVAFVCFGVIVLNMLLGWALQSPVYVTVGANLLFGAIGVVLFSIMGNRLATFREVRNLDKIRRQSCCGCAIPGRN